MSEAPPLVRLALESERDAVANVLTDAFVDEDGLNWWLRQGGAKTRARRRFFKLSVGNLINAKRELWCAQASEGARMLGAAIWLPPGAEAFDASGWEGFFATPLFLLMSGARGAARGNQLGAMLAQHHPKVPHAHLVFLGVAPSAQGFGVGSAILKTTLAQVDTLGVPAYLEASKARNVALYQRHGFEVTAEFDVPDGGPHFWTMVRPPRR